MPTAVIARIYFEIFETYKEILHVSTEKKYLLKCYFFLNLELELKIFKIRFVILILSRMNAIFYIGTSVLKSNKNLCFRNISVG